MGTAGLERAPQLLAPSCVLRVVVETAPVQVARAPTHLPFLHGRGCHSCRAPRASLQLRAAARRARALQSCAASRGAANVGERRAELGSWVAESPSRRVHEPREETLPGNGAGRVLTLPGRRSPYGRAGLPTVLSGRGGRGFWAETRSRSSPPSAP